MASKYDRIAADLRRQVQAGDLTPGQQLRPEEELATEYGVSLNTLRRALEALEGEGLIDKRHGTGNFVRETRQRIKRDSAERYRWEKMRVPLPENERKATGATEKDTGLERTDLRFQTKYDSVKADADLAAAFGVPKGTKLLRRYYATRKQDERGALGATFSYLVWNVAAKNPALLKESNEPWPGGTQHQLSTIGIELDRIVDSITARPPTSEEIESLELPTGVSVILLRKTSIDTSGAVVEVSDVTLPGDRVELQYTTVLDRWK